jgi:histidine triad (HIT) family protein
MSTHNSKDMSDCIFCDILCGKRPSSVVYRDDRCTALMDIQPINRGHVLVIPNSHATCLADLEDGFGPDLFRVAQRVAAALRASGLKCEGVNLFLADGEAAGQEVFHVHLHVFPRHKGDGFGFKFPPDYSNKPERSELEMIARRIKEAL